MYGRYGNELKSHVSQAFAEVKEIKYGHFGDHDKNTENSF